MYRLRLLWWCVLCCLAVPGMVRAQITLPPSLNFATSPSPTGSGARAQGQALAFIGVADDATAASHNPAGLVQLEWPEVSIVGAQFTRFEHQDLLNPNVVVEDQTLDSFSLNYLSVAYPFELWQRNIVVSVNFQRLFDLKGATDVASLFAGVPDVSGLQQVQSRQTGSLFTISPAVAVQVTPRFSLGVAFNIWPDLFDNGWEQDVKVRGTGSARQQNSIVAFESSGRIREDFAFEGFNVTAGFLWQLHPMVTLGGVVRTPFTAQVTRTHRSALTVTFQDSAPVITRDRLQETLDLDMPVAYGLGVAVRPLTHLRLALDVSRIHWSDFRLETPSAGILVQNGAPSGKGQAVLQGAGDDTTTVRLGAEYLWVRPTVVIPVRAGGFYDPEPGENGLDRFFGGSVGAGLAIKGWLVDVAYTFRTGTVQSAATDTTVYQHTVLASVIYHFGASARR